MYPLIEEKTEDFDKLDFCLQSSNDSIIVTLLINHVPLYDCIVSKEAEFEHLTKEAKDKFLLEMYNFDNLYGEEIEEEELFYHNFPENLMLAVTRIAYNTSANPCHLVRPVKKASVFFICNNLKQL